MVEIGKLIVFNFVHLFDENKSIYSIFRSWDLFMLFLGCWKIHEWHGKTGVHWTKLVSNISLKERESECERAYYFIYNKIPKSLIRGVGRQWISISKYLHHPSKMDRHHVYSTIIWRRLLGNTLLQCAIHWNDPEIIR